MTYGFVSLLMLIILYIKYKKTNLFFSLISYIVGIIIGSIPAIIYFTKYKCWADFFNCMKIATSAKGGTDGLLTHLIEVMSNKPAWVIAIAFLILALLNEQFSRVKYKHNWNNKISLLLEVLIIFDLVYIFKSFIGNYVSYFSSTSKMMIIFFVYVHLSLFYFLLNIKCTLLAKI